MAINITEDKRAEIRHRADIVEIISERIVLKKAGKDFVGLCPFHSEKTPSFTVSPVKQIYYCFGCGAGGDVFSFMMKYDGVGFSEAVKNAISEASKTVRHIDWFEVMEQRGNVKDDKVMEYQVVLKVGFKIEH